MRISDWSSDVCSSDLQRGDDVVFGHRGHAPQVGYLAARFTQGQVAQCKRLVARYAAGAQAGVVDAAERVAVEAFAADGLLDAADDGRGRLAAELLVEDRAGERIDRVERPAPARVRVDRADPLHPLAELEIGRAHVRTP